MSINYWQDFEEGKIYHIYNKTSNNLVLFKDDSDYLLYLNKFKFYFSGLFDTYAYCLIPNHFHFLLKVKPLYEITQYAESLDSISSRKLLEGNISHSKFLISIFKNFFSSVSLSYKSKYNHSGQVFMKRFKRIAIESDSKLVYTFCYIHHNPIHHYLSLNYSKWNWSSYKAYISSESTTIKKVEFLEWLGGISTFHQLHEEFKIEKNKVRD